jgi:exopolysaccharide biosynthesis polyprenyl glycosylphosphotransferase
MFLLDSDGKAVSPARSRLPLPRRARRRPRQSWQRGYVGRLILADALVATLAASAAFLIRFGSSRTYTSHYLMLTALFPVAWLLTVLLSRGYEVRFLFLGTEEYRRILNSGLVLTALVAIVSYAAKMEVARGYVVIALPLVTLADLCARHVLRKHLHRCRRHQHRYMRRVVVVGYERGVAGLCRQLQRERFHGMEVVGACLPPHRPSKSRLDDVGVEVLGTFDQVVRAVDETDADIVAVLACPEMDADVLRTLAWQLEKTQTDLLVAPAVMDVAGPRTTIRPVDGLPLLHVEHPELSGGRRLIKGLFDRALAVTTLLVLFPFLFVIGIVIHTTSGGPALFRQIRVGRDGTEFVMFKFRTMHVDAEQRLTAVLALNEKDGVLFKVHDDPRITPIGRWLRRYSIDELPQLLNVVLGQMSLVGPRPPLPREVEQYAETVRRRLVVKPGMTGLWQVSGRADLSWDDSVRLDLRYVENWSLVLDLVILWRTVSAVVRSSGAY